MLHFFENLGLLKPRPKLIMRYMSSKKLVITALFFLYCLIVINTPEQRKGWSPNGRVIVCGKDKFVIEIKCPYVLVQQATIIDYNFPLCKSELNGELFVKNIISTISKCSCKYLLSVQMFLVIYTLKDLFKILVLFSSSFMEHCILLARLFWEQCILPEFFSCCFTNKNCVVF